MGLSGAEGRALATGRGGCRGARDDDGAGADDPVDTHHRGAHKKTLVARGLGVAAGAVGFTMRAVGFTPRAVFVMPRRSFRLSYMAA
jgi:hypothetical protein